MIYAFGDCELDTDRFELRRDGVRHHVEPQVFDVLVYLVEHRERVVSREELLAQVWGTSYVSEATLSSRLMAARKAIGDSGRAQALIRTVKGRGYEFIGELRAGEPPPLAEAATDQPLVARDEELDRLHADLDAAISGERRTVFVTGEAGVGKTTLVESFLERTRDHEQLLVARGFCLEHRGTGEPYMPVLEALSRLCAGRAGAPALEALRARAPTWLLELPWLLAPDEIDDVRRAALGATPERMLRQLAEALEALAAQTPLALVFEDLHWSDDSTLDLLSRLARRDEPARLLIVGTSRPGEGSVEALQRELRVRRRCTELRLQLLSEDGVRRQLETRLGAGELPAALAGAVHRRTEGNPLFVECLVDSWLDRDMLYGAGDGWELRDEPDRLAEGIPESLRDLIEQDLSHLSADDLAVLEAACVVGSSFVAAAIPVLDAEDRCSRLARGGRLIRLLGEAEWGPRQISTQFAFLHDLHREALYDRIPAGRRAGLHREVAHRLEQGYGEGAPERAVEIAFHCIEGRDAPGAVEHLRAAAEQARRRGGLREATRHLNQALDQLKAASGVAEPERVELSLQAALGPALMLTEGWASPEAEAALRRAVELSEQLADAPLLAAALYSLAGLMEYRGDYPGSEELMARCLALERTPPDPSADLMAHELMACSLFHQGEFDRAVEQARQGLALYDPRRLHEGPAAFGEDPAASCNDWAGLALGCLGFLDDAERSINAAIAIVDAPEHIYGLASARAHAARLHQLRGEAEGVEREARAALALATEQGFAYQAAVATMLLGCALSAGERGQEGLGLIHEGLAMHRQTGAEMDRPYFLALLAEAALAAGDLQAARSALDEALGPAAQGRPFFYEAELHRLRGELALRGGGGVDAAEPHYHEAIELARRQGARALELRAALGLVRAQGGPRRDAMAVESLARLVDWFPAEADSADLRAARRLLGDVASTPSAP